MNETLISSSDDIALSLSGVWWQRFIPLLHQHVSGPPLRPAGTGAYFRRTRRGRRFWQPLLQSLPLPAVATRHKACTVYICTNTQQYGATGSFLHFPPLTCSLLNLAVIVPSVWPFSLPKLTRETLLVVRGKRDDLWPTRMAAADWCSLETSFTFHLNVEYLKRL